MEGEKAPWLGGTFGAQTQLFDRIEACFIALPSFQLPLGISPDGAPAHIFGNGISDGGWKT